MKSIIRIVLLLIGVLSIGCYEDKGNYDLVDYNKIEEVVLIPSLSNTAVYLGDTVRIAVSMQYKYPDRDTITGFEYVWKENWEGDTLGTSRVLEYVPGEAKSYTFYLHVREVATGITTRFSFSARVSSPYSSGWLIASQRDGKPCLTFIRRDSRRNKSNQLVYFWTDFVNIYDELHPGTPLNSNALVGVSTYPVSYSGDEVIVFHERGEGEILKGTDFSKMMNLKDDFMGGVLPSGFEPVSFARGGYCDYLLGKDGEVYWRSNLNGSSLAHETSFMDVPLYFPGGSVIDYFVDMRIYEAEFTLMHDKLKNRIVGCANSFSSSGMWNGKMLNITNTYRPEEFVNILNMEGYKLIYCGDYTNGKSFVNILKEESSGNYIYQNFKLMGYTADFSVTEANREIFAGSELISDNTVFFRLRRSSYLYFGEGSKLYFYDVNSKKVKLYTDFGSGNITQIIQDAEGTRVGITLDNGNFYLCEAVSTNVLGAENPGAVGILHHLSGLGDIKNMVWKWGTYSSMIGNRY